MRPDQRNDRPAPARAHVTILLATRDGAAHLGPQLDSIAAQSHRDWSLIVSDDGSADATCTMVERFARQRENPVTLLQGPGRGSAANFLFLMREWAALAPPDAWMAFSDQDDVWLADKIARAVDLLARVPAGGPALYCSRSWVCDTGLANRRLSAPRPHPPGFRNALVQNIAAGNTIVLNPAAARLAAAAAQEAGQVVVHDWWLYQLITGCGGTVLHDDRPGLLYRQHSGNLIGANDGLAARARRVSGLLGGTVRDWNAVNIAALRRSAYRLTPENRALLEAFAHARRAHLPARLAALARLGLYRQSRPATLSLYLAALLRRL